MSRRSWALVLGLGLVISMVAAMPASAAAKKKLPDLVVAKVSVTPVKVAAGGVLKVSDTTRNKGRKAAKKSVTRYALSKNKKLDKKDVVLGNRKVKKLKPRKKHAVRARAVRVPARTKPGKYWLLVCADAQKKVRESNERNNCRTAKKRITVTKRKPAGPRDGVVKVTVKGHVDWSDRTRNATGSHTTEIDSDATFDFKVPAELRYLNGKPFSLYVLWDKASVTGKTVYKRVSNDACPVTTTSQVRVTGQPSQLGQVMIQFPAAGIPAIRAGLSLAFNSTNTSPYTSVNCRGETSTSGDMRFEIVDAPDDPPTVSANAALTRIVVKTGGAPRTHPGRTWKSTITLNITHPR